MYTHKRAHTHTHTHTHRIFEDKSVELVADWVRLSAALVMDYASKYSFHGLDLVLYMQDETRYKLTNHDKFTAASFQGLIDTFVRAGSMNAPATSEFAVRPVFSYVHTQHAHKLFCDTF